VLDEYDDDEAIFSSWSHFCFLWDWIWTLLSVWVKWSCEHFSISSASISVNNFKISFVNSTMVGFQWPVLLPVTTVPVPVPLLLLSFLSVSLLLLLLLPSVLALGVEGVITKRSFALSKAPATCVLLNSARHNMGTNTGRLFAIKRNIASLLRT